MLALLQLIICSEAGETIIQYKWSCATHTMYFSCFSKDALVKKSSKIAPSHTSKWKLSRNVSWAENDNVYYIWISLMYKNCFMWQIVLRTKQELRRKYSIKAESWTTQTYLITASPNYVLISFDYKKLYEITKIVIKSSCVWTEDSSFYPRIAWFLIIFIT